MVLAGWRVGALDEDGGALRRDAGHGVLLRCEVGDFGFGAGAAALALVALLVVAVIRTSDSSNAPDFAPPPAQTLFGSAAHTALRFAVVLLVCAVHVFVPLVVFRIVPRPPAAYTV